jgi:hypothetical protein
MREEITRSAKGPLVDAIEKAIRNAFDRGDPSDRVFREKVYRSAFAALERALQANENVQPEVAQQRRQSLSATISEIETEFIPAAPAIEPDPSPRRSPADPGPPEIDTRTEPAAVAVPPPELDREPAGQDVAFEPRIDARDRPDAPAISGGTARAGDEIAMSPTEYEGTQGRGRRSWVGWLVGLVILAAAGAAAWWAYDNGYLTMPEQAASPTQPEQPEDVPQNPAAETPQQGMPGGASGLEDWTVVFEPSDPTSVAAPGDTSAEVVEEEGETFIRVRSGASGSPVLFDVNQGILEQLAGGRAVFNIVARATEETQISVECSLGQLGDCGRRRYVVGQTREEFLFEVDLPDASLDAGGTISVNPDVDGGGKALDIYEIRVSPAAE